MKKLIIDGKVAVLVSPGYGAGWSTWNNFDLAVDLIFHYDIASMLHNKVQFSQIEQYAKAALPDAQLHGLDKVEIQWVPEGTRFQIKEYDGSEWIETHEDQQWITA